MNKTRRKVKLIANEGLPILSRKFGRNEPCTCGSGRKNKACCGTETRYAHLRVSDEVKAKAIEKEKIKAKLTK